MSSKKVLQLAALLGQGAQTVAPPGTAPAVGGKKIQESAGAGVQAEIEKEAAEKADNGWGNIGGTLGGMLGVLAAPATGGASLALSGGLGAAAGNAIGQYADTGQVDPFNVLNAGVQGAAPHVLNAIDTKLNPAPATVPTPAPAPEVGGAASARPYVGHASGAASPTTGPTTPTVPNAGGGGNAGSPSAYSKAGFQKKLGSMTNGMDLLQQLQGNTPFSGGTMGPKRYKYNEQGQLVEVQ